jgi:hypothetical protein
MRKSAFLSVILLVATYCFGFQKPIARAIRIDSDKAVKARAMRVDLDKVEPGAKKEKWLSTGREDSSTLGGGQWISYYNGIPYVIWELPQAEIEMATKFVKADFPIQYPFWIKKLKNMFYEITPCNQFKFKIYNSAGDELLYESPNITALKYPATTTFDLGADSVKITAGNFWVSCLRGDVTPSSMSDSGAIRNRSSIGQIDNWAPAIPQGYQEACFEFAIQAYVSWGVGTEETINDMSVEVKYLSNPAKRYGSILYTIPTKTYVNIELYDITGKVVATLEDGIKSPGKYEVVIGPELVAGVYFCKFKAGSFNKTKKIVLL